MKEYRVKSHGKYGSRVDFYEGSHHLGYWIIDTGMNRFHLQELRLFLEDGTLPGAAVQH